METTATPPLDGRVVENLQAVFKMPCLPIDLTACTSVSQRVHLLAARIIVLKCESCHALSEALTFPRISLDGPLSSSIWHLSLALWASAALLLQVLECAELLPPQDTWHDASWAWRVRHPGPTPPYIAVKSPAQAGLGTLLPTIPSPSLLSNFMSSLSSHATPVPVLEHGTHTIGTLHWSTCLLVSHLLPWLD